MSISAGIIELDSTGYYQISYRIVLEDPITAKSYVSMQDGTVLEASVVNESYTESLTVYEKTFIAACTDWYLYLALESDIDSSATTAQNGIVFTASKLGDIHLFLTPHTNYLAYRETVNQSDLVTVTTDPPDQPVTWSSSDDSIATVDAEGNVTGVGEEKVLISGKIAAGETVSYTLNTFETIALGGNFHTLALKSDGTVWAWGRNTYGQLGDNTTTQRNTPVQTHNLTDVISIAAGSHHSLALKSDGTVWAWGNNNYGRLGDNTTTERHTPVQTHNLTDVISIAAGNQHSMALQSDGTVWAWGNNEFGQLGDNTTTNRSTPVQTENLTDVISIAAGLYHSLALQSDGAIWAWGNNYNGELGDNTTTERHIPVQTLNLTEVISIAAGVIHSLALKTDGTVWAWGSNEYAQLGNGIFDTDPHPLPAQTLNLTNVIAIAAGGYHSLALKSDGSLWAWGENYYGQLGDNTTIGSITPVRVHGSNDVGWF
jgi:alpha-tubulin suppressor-like RCC1 family protein